jgi:heme-degrading monooxygenase HmoA
MLSSSIHSRRSIVFARTSIWTGTPEALDKWAAGAETVRSFVEGLDGNVGAFLCLDRPNRKALTLTLWDSDDAARASDVAADQSRARTMAATGVELLERGQYEVVARSSAT